MKTQVFESYFAFLQREDQSINGVTQLFLDANPGCNDEWRNNKGTWNCSDCSDCSGCSDCYRCSRCSDCSGCSRCSDCYRCYRCYRCSDCSRCSDCYRCYRCYRCSDCSDCSDLAPQKIEETIPIIEDIHTEVFHAVSVPGALNMGDWHTCETTHCRAGWVVHLAGEQGKALEKRTSTLHAAMQIYHASSPIHVPPTRFYDVADRAMIDMERCAKEEAALKP